MARVLVADDDQAFRTLIGNILTTAGHEILEASSAVEVFETIEQHLPDLILLDVHLGPDDGLAIGAGLRREQRYRDTRIVFMTGTLDSVELAAASRQFKAKILPKPFDPDELLTVVGGPAF